ncbi:MAG: 4-(cytidine 5'-diphospho)-2-C-methyl-D-erythritol kinase [Acetatifactor sp.]|nr:4-(cytidine 5'-diphospho)-2-C-methyl-D-erythritol kinase [Acetatifactor sp.]
MPEKKAYAKINLGLDVIGTLPNGYHEVKMIMQTVGIYDVLTFEKTESDITISTDSGELPVGEDNLIYKAAKLLMDTYKVKGGVRIHLEKHIPIAAGMAGGSTDAAATLKGVNELYGLGCTLEELQKIGVKIGADVPYCLMGGTALAEGIGEKLTGLPAAPQCYLLVAKPDINVSTKYVYEHLDAEPILNHPDIDGMIAAIRSDNLEGVASRLGNVLETVTENAYPIIGELKQLMLESGASGSLMSGSGPTVFGIFTDKTKARNAFEDIVQKKLVKQIFLTDFVSENE